MNFGEIILEVVDGYFRIYDLYGNEIVSWTQQELNESHSQFDKSDLGLRMTSHLEAGLNSLDDLMEDLGIEYIDISNKSLGTKIIKR